MSEDDLLEDLERRVAERQPVDWDEVLARLDAVQAGPEERDAFSLLRLLDEVGSFNSSLQTGVSESGASTIPSLDPVTDDTLESWGRYLLDGKVGRGGFGSVYRAWDPVLEMPVAIKILHRRFSDERLKERLVQEGRALAQIRHANVVSVLNVEQHDGRLGLVMEFISGETLDALVARQGRLNEREASIIAEDVCRALEAVHAKELIHRDVKARNIIREQAGRIVLMDFGAGLPTNAVQEKGRAVGTPLYMAPEHLAGQPATVTSDVYSVGVLLFYLVTGRHPYEGNTVEEIRGAQAAGPPKSVLHFRPDLPIRFVSVVDRTLAVDPALRLQTPAAVIQSLVNSRPSDRGVEPEPSLGKRVGRLSVWGALSVVLVLFGGILSTASFNATLGRSDYATDSLGTWLEFGIRPLATPVLLTLFGTVAISLAVASRNALRRVSVRIQAVDRFILDKCRTLADSVALREPAVCCCWLAVVTGLAAVGIWASWAELWYAITSDISTAPAATLEILSPPLRDSLTHHRMLLSVLAAANVTGWYVLRRATTASRENLPSWFTASEIAVLVLLYGSMVIPYRIARDSDTFDQVSWRGEKCFLLGERPADTLLFCPTRNPRILSVAKSEALAERVKAGTSVFKSFAPPSRIRRSL